MPNLKKDEYLNIAFRRHDVPASDFHTSRNLLAVQGALVRGDVEVVLHNASALKPALKKRLRRMHEPGTDHAQELTVRFRDVQDDVIDKFKKVDFSAMFNDVQWHGLRFEFVKVFGAGSFGAATLWKVHLEGGITEKVVMKSAISSKSEFNSTEEAFWHRRYHGSRHTVQIVDLASLAKTVQNDFKETNPGEPLKYNGGIGFDAEDYQALVLEYMCHGNLFQIVQKASLRGKGRGEYFPDRVLWGIWECLVRGVAAVAYQPTFTITRDEIFEEELDRARQENRLEEFFDMLERVQINHDVHFDFEETNILAGEASDHPNQPVFKIHDFGGFSYNMNLGWRMWGFKDYWRRRHIAKMTRLLPEQVHQDWDRIATHESWEEAVKEFQGEDLTTGHPIAGRYGSWSNVFFAAKTMEAVATMIYIAHPFNTREYVTLDGNKTANTYGWRLMDGRFRFISAGLRDILCQCLFERPIDRPGIVSLLRQIEARKEKGFGQTDAGVRKYWETLFTPEPERPIPDPQPQAPEANVQKAQRAPPRPDAQQPEFRSRGRRAPAPEPAPRPSLLLDRPRRDEPVQREVQEARKQPSRDLWNVPRPRQPGTVNRPADYRSVQFQVPAASQKRPPALYRGTRSGGPASPHVALEHYPQRAPLRPVDQIHSQFPAHQPQIWHPLGYPPTDSRMQHAAFRLPPHVWSYSTFHDLQGPEPRAQQQYRGAPSGVQTDTYRGVQYNQPPPPPPQRQQRDNRPGPQGRRQQQVPDPSPSGGSPVSECDMLKKPPNVNPADQAHSGHEMDWQFDERRPGEPRAGVKDIVRRGRPKQAGKVTKKRREQASKPKRRPRHRPAAITAYVERALPDMPVAIRNLWVRAKQLDEMLKEQSFDGFI